LIYVLAEISNIFIPPEEVTAVISATFQIPRFVRHASRRDRNSIAYAIWRRYTPATVEMEIRSFS
jgi:hypothetical protein